MDHDENGNQRAVSRRAMHDTGSWIRALREPRSRELVVELASLAAGEQLSVDWLRRIEEGSRPSIAPWEARAIAAALKTEGWSSERVFCVVRDRLEWMIGPKDEPW